MSRFSVESVFKAVDKVTAPVSRMQNRVSKFTRGMQRGLRKVNSTINSTIKGIKNVGKAALKFGAIGIGAVTGAVTLLVREFSKVENAQAAFTPLLGGAERAKEAVQAINDTAATTPFQFETLAKSVNQLLPVMNGNIGDTIKTVRMMGDAVGGNAQKLESITRGFTKAMLKGKVDMESLNMIAEAGVPIFTELADSMGTKVSPAFFKMISAGKVTTKQLNSAFEKMTNKGGIFFNGMEIASKTTTGLFSTLKDNISLTAAELGGVLAPTIKDLIKQATGVAQRVREWVKSNRELINTKFLEWVEVAKRFVIGLVDGFDFIRKHGKTITKVAASIVGLVLVLKTLGAVMAIVNIVMLANPIGLIVLAITALIAAVAAAIIWWDELKGAFFDMSNGAVIAIAAVTGPIGWLVGAAALVMKNWEPIKTFFKDLWSGVVSIFDSAVAKITAIVDKVKAVASGVSNIASSVGDFVFGDDSERRSVDRRGRPTNNPQIVSPQERTASLIEERRTTSTAEVTIKDETNRAEITKGSFGAGVALVPSGAF